MNTSWKISKMIMITGLFINLMSMPGCETFKRGSEVYDSTRETPLENLRAWDINKEDRKMLIVMVHGFISSNNEAWGEFPEILAEKKDGELSRFNVVRYGYSSQLCRNKLEISTLGEGLSSFLIDESHRYRGIIIVAHSMGGLVVMEALTRLARDNNRNLDRLPVIVMTFGTPYFGVKGPATLGQLSLLCEDKQAQAMNEFDRPLGDLRALYNSYFEDRQRFKYQVFTKRFYGETDDFVTKTSACGGSDSGCEQVQGNHVMIVKPSKPHHLVPYRKLISQVSSLTNVVDGIAPTAPSDIKFETSTLGK